MAVDVAALGGGLTIERRLDLVNLAGVPIGEITSEVLDLTVSWSVGMEGGTAMRLEFQLIERSAPLDPQNTFVMPWITYRWGDGTERKTPLGVFLLGLPRKTISPGGVIATYTGKDLTWVLFNSTLTKSENIRAGTNYGEAIASICRAAGLTNLDIRRTTRTLSRDRTFRRRVHRREMINNLVKPIGWYNIFMSLNGAMTTLPYRDWSTAQPVGVLTPRVLIGEIQATPSVEDVPNTVMATMERSGQAPVIRYAFNTDPDSPISLQNIIPPGRRITHRVTDSNVETIADLERLAQQTLRDVSSFQKTYTATVKPDPSWLGIHRTIDVDPSAVTNGEPGAGRYRLLGWRAGTSPENVPIQLTIGKSVGPTLIT